MSAETSYTDEYGVVHYSRPRAIGGAGPAWWTSENDCNPTCGCHLSAFCRGCSCCTECAGCFCNEDDW